METSHLIRSLRVTFLTIGFLMFVIMAVHWVQHVSTARPVLTPRVIAVTPGPGNGPAAFNSEDLRDTSLTALVQRKSEVSSTRASTSSTPAHKAVSASAHPASSHEAKQSAPLSTAAQVSAPSQPSKPAPPAPSTHSNGPHNLRTPHHASGLHDS